MRQRPNPAASWLQEPSWQQLLHLSALPAFAGIADAIAADPSAWQAVYNAPEPHKATLPGMYSRLEEFRQLLVLRCACVHSPLAFYLHHLSADAFAGHQQAVHCRFDGST